MPCMVRHDQPSIPGLTVAIQTVRTTVQFPLHSYLLSNPHPAIDTSTAKHPVNRVNARVRPLIGIPRNLGQIAADEKQNTRYFALSSTGKVIQARQDRNSTRNFLRASAFPIRKISSFRKTDNSRSLSLLNCAYSVLGRNVVFVVGIQVLKLHLMLAGLFCCYTRMIH